MKFVSLPSTFQINLLDTEHKEQNLTVDNYQDDCISVCIYKKGRVALYQMSPRLIVFQF